ncbi:MAG TPA: hemerythrin domain-containing protein [Nocardioides sp.]|jgi:hemerythrin-like domain-containing protein|nr:hemerythrin domain-containing protein [Nocardioides sp.]
MCDYCGCREVPVVGELISEHRHLQDEADHIRRAMAAGDLHSIPERLRHLVSHLARHVSREEDGIFTALRRQGDYVDEVADLEGEHRWLDAAIADLDPESPELVATLSELFDALELHIQREDLGIFPVSVVTLGAEGWDLVQRVHDDQPTFLDTTGPERVS